MSVAKKKQTMTGVVVSNKMLKTVVVLVTNKQRHKQYGKYVNRASKILAHSANPCKEGDTVVIESCRPISKNKSWMVVNVLNG